MDTKHIIINNIPLYLLDSKCKDSGIKSVIEIINITPDAKAKLEQINLLIFLILKKIRITPSIVENPAIKVNKKDIVILFIIFTNKIYYYYMKKITIFNNYNIIRV